MLISFSIIIFGAANSTEATAACLRYQREELIRSLTVNKNSSNLLSQVRLFTSALVSFIASEHETYGRVQARFTALYVWLVSEEINFSLLQINVVHCFTFFFTFLLLLLDNNNSLPTRHWTQQWMNNLLLPIVGCLLSFRKLASTGREEEEAEVEVRKKFLFIHNFLLIYYSVIYFCWKSRISIIIIITLSALEHRTHYTLYGQMAREIFVIYLDDGRRGNIAR